MKSRIPYAKPSITTTEMKYAQTAAMHEWGKDCNHSIDEFEAKFRSHIDTEYAIATSSCTGALHLGLKALGIGPGDEVIVPELTWIATVAPVTYLGATPVFADVDPHTWCIDPVDVVGKITPRTKAIIAVHLYGNMCDLESISVATNIPIIEDAAEAIGSIYYGRQAGSMGVFGVFSFHGSKTITTGEGGMLVTNYGDIYERVRSLNNHGRVEDEERQFYPHEIGYKYRMSNIQAALGCAQMDRMDSLIIRKQQIFEYYYNALKDLPVEMNQQEQGIVNGCWMPTVVVKPEVEFSRDRLFDDFKRENIDARVFFWPLSSLPMFEKADNPVAYSVSYRGFNLPSFHDITDEDMDRVIEVVRRNMR